ncbi:MAG: hypothetical protein CM15mP21_7810 [Hyphomicrobiales bacterium]|nr:MAG: hypothetical protein CM15mP21_7810 [Hyphomicrobiales bacterium]
MDYRQARTLLGDKAIIGVTCHASRHLAMLAGDAGADYVAFGAFSTPKPKTQRTTEPDILTWWQEVMEPPCVAIGGITPENGDIGRRRADFLAVSGGVWQHPRGRLPPCRT